MTNKYTPTSEDGAGRSVRNTIVYPSASDIETLLRKLSVDSSSGPDEVPTRILKECASALAAPIAELLQIIIDSGTWPRVWAEHWIFPLFKRKANFLASNYRGIHLTSQLSKIAERAIGNLFLQELQAAGAYGENQFAYTTGRGARDAIALLVLRWIHGWSLKLIWAIYCSDVSGAFDKVSTDILMGKLRRLNIHPKILAVLESWLQARNAKVIVDGESSFEFWLREMVYQGTVWGPPLWNIHFSDARQAIRASGFEEVVFADDLNAYKSFHAGTPEESLRTVAILAQAICVLKPFVCSPLAARWRDLPEAAAQF